MIKAYQDTVNLNFIFSLLNFYIVFYLFLFAVKSEIKLISLARDCRLDDNQLPITATINSHGSYFLRILLFNLTFINIKKY